MQDPWARRAAASPWAAPRAAECAPESTWAEEGTWIPVGAAAAGSRWACVSSGCRPCHPPEVVVITWGVSFIIVIAWLHVLLRVTSVKVASRLLYFSKIKLAHFYKIEVADFLPATSHIK